MEYSSADLDKWKNMMVMLWLFSANNTGLNNY